MSVRTFDGTDDFIRCTGTLGASFNAACSILLLVYPTTLPTGDEPFFSIGNSTTATAGTIYNDSGNSGANIAWGNSAADSIGNVGLTASAWQLIGGSKATGADSSVILHRKVLGSGSWSHVSGTGTINNNANVCTDAFFGRFNDSATFRDFSLAVCAIYTTELSNANVETIETAASTASMLSFSPVAAWEFNQASTATTVTDLIGNTHEASKTGTTVTEGIDPAWTFSGTGAATSFPRRTFSPIPLMKTR